MRHPIVTARIDPELQASLQKELAEACHDLRLQPVWKRQPAELLPRFARYYVQLTHLPRRVRRQLVRQWKRSLSVLALLLALGQAPAALAATITVDGTTCTLVHAITAANSDTATGGCPAGSGADTLELVAGSTHTLTRVNNSTNGLPVIRSTVTIEGHGSTIKRKNGAPAFRILAVNSTGDLTLNETTVSEGMVSYGSRPFGGGIYNQGTLNLTNSTVSGNTASGSGNPSALGGGVFSRSGTTTLTNSTVSGNSANRGYGGGVFISSGTVTLTNSTVSGNSAGSGGGVFNELGTTT